MLVELKNDKEIQEVVFCLFCFNYIMLSYIFVLGVYCEKLINIVMLNLFDDVICYVEGVFE